MVDVEHQLFDKSGPFACRCDPETVEEGTVIGLSSPMLSSDFYSHPHHRPLALHYAYEKKGFL
jgi:hypothetical protein